MYSDFSEWLSLNNGLFERFDCLSNCLERYLLEQVLISPEKSQEVAERFQDVRENCDNIDFDIPGVVEAYSIWHFLDRYHRFQLIFTYLLKEGVLPIKQLPIDILDVGTGPAPVLFALSDIYHLLRRYGNEKDIAVLKSIEFRNDYIELKSGFRCWLHYFTEYANYFNRYVNSNECWRVPYHHGSFWNFEGLNFQMEKCNYFEQHIQEIEDDFDSVGEDVPSSQFIIDNLLDPNWKNSLRYDLICFSHFLTSKDVVERLSNELRSAGFALRNKGIILVVGGRGDPYPLMYDQTSHILVSQKYNKKKSVSELKEYKLPSNEMSYPFNDPFAQKIRQLYRSVLDRFIEYNVEDCVPTKALADFKEAINNEAGSRKWAIHVYRKKKQG